MITFLSLNDAYKGYTIALCVVSMITLLVALVVYIIEKKRDPYTLLLAFLLVINIINLSSLSELNKLRSVNGSDSLFFVSTFVNTLPYFVHVAFCTGCIIFAIYSMYTYYINNKNKINAFSVKLALENLPTGIVFMSDNVELLLSNHIMHRLCKELTEKTLQSGLTLWDDLITLQNKNNCVISGEEPAFALPNGEVWQFSKKACKYQGDEYHEIKATNITELYNLSENARKVNEKLKFQQQRLETLTGIIQENAEKQVAVNMKVNFHDNFGNLLALAKKTLRETEDINNVKALVDYWGGLSDVITELSSDDNQNLTLEQIMHLANNLGCEIELIGEIPQQHFNKTTVLLCINEMLKNAYRHADAQRLTVNIVNDENEVNFTIHNETKNRIMQIKEGGGLTGLRQRIEQNGGKMSMDCAEGVTMTVKLNNND